MVVACAGGGADDESSATTAGAAEETSSAPTPTTAAPTTAAVTPAGRALLDALTGVLLPLSTGGSTLPPPDEACVSRALEGANPSVRRAADELVRQPDAWEGLPDQDVRPLVQSFLDCAGAEDVLAALAKYTLRSTEAPTCVAPAWAEAGMTTDVLADSLVYGRGLEDLPDPLVDDLVAAATECVPDEQWWVESLGIVLSNGGLPADQAQCVAAAYVSTIGVPGLIRHRVLTIPELALPPDQQEALDLGTRCAAMVPSPFSGPPATQAGQCMADFNKPDRPSSLVPCDQPHDVEVFAIEDLTGELTKWPGARGLIEQTAKLCDERMPVAIASRPDLVVYRYQPSRSHWEMGNRRIGCGVALADGQPSTGPSGVLVAPATVPFAALAVGQCLAGPELTRGDIGDTFMDAVDCNVVHHGEVFHVSDLPDGPFPGDSGVEELANTACVPAFEAYVGRPVTSSNLEFWFFYPNEAGWSAGDRRLLCYITAGEDRELVGSKAGADE